MPSVLTDDARAAWVRLRATTWAMCALVFLAAFVFAPKHGLIAAKRRAQETTDGPV